MQKPKIGGTHCLCGVLLHKNQ